MSRLVTRGQTVAVAAAVLVLLVLAACTPTDTHSGPTRQDLLERLEPCVLAAPGIAERREARCTTVTVFEDRAAASGRTIDLQVAVVPATRQAALGEPVVFLAGGPGQAATEAYLSIAPVFALLNDERDILLVDQRGTGGSNPLHCPAGDPTVEPGMERGATLKWVRDCLESVSARADPRFYTTPTAMDDLEQVRAALGYERLNLVGVSYGTRAALMYMRAYPERVRTAILDGLAPPNLVLGPGIAPAAQRALDLAFARCASEATCVAAFPHLPTAFADLLAQSEGAGEVTVQHPVTGQSQDLQISRETITNSVRFLSYSTETVALLPLLIHQAAVTEDLRTFGAQALLVTEPLERGLAAGMSNSVLCTEDAPWFPAPADLPPQGYLGTSILENMRWVCEVWPRGPLPADYKEPVVSTVPTLLLSGEADPVTPPEYGEMAARTLSNSRHLVVPGQGHNVLPRGCVPRLATEFIRSGHLDGLETGCVQQLAAMPFFLDLTGPRP